MISAGDDGIHGDGDVVTRADIMIFRCYGGIEVGSVSIEDSGIQINTSDDGINAAGGSPAGWDLGSAGSENVTALSGGSVQVTAGGDGLDSNGSIEISGEEMIVLIHSSADNETMDFDGNFTVTRGNLIYGGTGTGAGPQGRSIQSYVYTSGSFQAGRIVSVQSGASEIIRFTPAISCTFLIFSVPGMNAGDAYDICAGGQVIATVTAGQGGNWSSPPRHGTPMFRQTLFSEYRKMERR